MLYSRKMESGMVQIHILTGMNIKTQPVDSTDGGHLYTFSSEAAAYMALDYTDAENPVLKSFSEVCT